MPVWLNLGVAGTRTRGAGRLADRRGLAPARRVAAHSPCPEASSVVTAIKRLAAVPALPIHTHAAAKGGRESPPQRCSTDIITDNFQRTRKLQPREGTLRERPAVRAAHRPLVVQPGHPEIA